jgi:hypothetical protein
MAERKTVDEAAQRRRYGGFNLGAAFFGWLVANGVGVLLTALLAAAGSAVALSTLHSAGGLGRSADTVGVVSGILLALDVAIAYYAGGYVAGRMSRFDGGRQGFGVWLWGLLAAIVLGLAGAGFGAKYNLLQQLNLPHIAVDQGTFTTGGVITFLAIIVVSVLAAIGGGKAGEAYHRKIDRAGLN